MKYATKRGVEAVPFVEGSEDLVRANGAELNSLLGHGFETVLELGTKGRESWRRTIGPGSPRE